jgi:protein phosphatase 2C
VSALCRNQMHSILAEDLASEASRFLERRRQQAAVWARGERAEEEAAWCAALRRAFARVDALSPLACACGAAIVPRCACPLSGTTSAIVGSTAVVALVVGARVVVANCGDSRAVLCRGPHGAPPVPLSVDHKVRLLFLPWSTITDVSVDSGQPSGHHGFSFSSLSCFDVCVDSLLPVRESFGVVRASLRR